MNEIGTSYYTSKNASHQELGRLLLKTSPFAQGVSTLEGALGFDNGTLLRLVLPLGGFINTPLLFNCACAITCSKHVLQALKAIWLRAIRTVRAMRAFSQCIRIGIGSTSCSCEWSVYQPLEDSRSDRGHTHHYVPDSGVSEAPPRPPYQLSTPVAATPTRMLFLPCLCVLSDWRCGRRQTFPSLHLPSPPSSSSSSSLWPWPYHHYTTAISAFSHK